MMRMLAIILCALILSSASSLLPAKENHVGISNIIKIVTHVGDTVSIGLPSNPTTGYSWRLKEPHRKDILEFTGSEYIPDGNAQLGSGGKEVWNFKATAEGATPLVFIYKRPWEGRKPNDKIARFIIAIQPALVAGNREK